MNISLAWAQAVPAAGAAMRTAASSAIVMRRRVMGAPPCSSGMTRSVRERPEPQLLLGDLPEAREPVRLRDQEEDDEAAEDHQLDLLLEGHRHRDAHQV